MATFGDEQRGASRRSARGSPMGPASPSSGTVRTPPSWSLIRAHHRAALRAALRGALRAAPGASLMFALSGCTVEQRCRDSRDCVDTQTCVVQAGIGSCRARTPTTAPGDAAAQATIDGAAPDNAPEDADRGDAPHVDVAPDSGVPQESGLLDDSTSADGGPDASLDAGERSEVGGDAGTLEETGSPRDPDAPDADAGVVETGAPDAGEPTRLDAGDPDAGLGQDAHDDGDGAPDAGGAPPQAEPEPVRAAQPRAIPALEPMALRPARGRTFKMTGGLISTRPAPRMTGGAYTLGSSITTTTQGTP